MLARSKGSIELDGVSQAFSSNGADVTLFQHLNLSIHQGQSYAITGPSGAGKSSLLMLMSGLEQPSAGAGYYVNSEEASNKLALSEIRDAFGFVFQQFHLLPELTAVNNVALPLRLRGIKDAEQRAKKWLERVGLGHRLDHKPNQLSGGEQQRVAIARALVFEPSFIFADEPTGNLDGNNANDIADLLFDCCLNLGAGLIVVTHSEALAARAQHRFVLENGECHQLSGAYLTSEQKPSAEQKASAVQKVAS